MGLHENRRVVPSSLRTISGDCDIMVIYVFFLFMLQIIAIASAFVMLPR